MKKWQGIQKLLFKTISDIKYDRNVGVRGQNFIWYYINKTREFWISDKRSKTRSANILKTYYVIYFTGTDEDSIINVLAYRSNPQRHEIYTTYKTMFGKVIESSFCVVLVLYFLCGKHWLYDGQNEINDIF